MSTRPSNPADLKEWAKQRRRSASQGRRQTVNAVGRANKAVSINVGGKGARRFTKSSQRVRVKQDPQGTVEQVETQETYRED